MSIDFRELLVTKEQYIKTIMEKLEVTKQKNLYVVDSDRRLIGSVTDGDIRRGILKGISLQQNVGLIMNTNPKFIIQGRELNTKKIKKIMLDHRIESIPIVDDNNIVINILNWIEMFKESKTTPYNLKHNKVFIVAGGRGTRLEPFTKILPKPLIPIGNETIIEKIMNSFMKYGFNNFILSLNYKAEMIKLYFSDKDIKDKYKSIEYVEENIPLGTIGSLALIRYQIEDTFFITNCDILIEENMENILRFHKESNAVFTIVGCIKNSIIPYGVLQLTDDGLLQSINEKPRYKHIINTGVYVAEPEILNYLEKNKKQDVTDLIDVLLKDNKNISVFPIRDDQWFDIGQWEEYRKTKKYFERF